MNPDSNYIIERASIKNDSIILAYYKAPNDSVHHLNVYNLNGNQLYNFTSPITDFKPVEIKFYELNNADALVSTDSVNADSTKKLYYLVQKDKPSPFIFLPVFMKWSLL